MGLSAKVRKQHQRVRDKAREEARLIDLIKNGSRERFWRENTERDKDKLDLPGLQAQVEIALDQAHWIDTGWAVAPDDENFVGFKEGFEELHRFLASVGGVIKEVNFKGFALQDVTPYWRVWRDFWREPILVAELQKESLPSAALSHLRLGDFVVRDSGFKVRVRCSSPSSTSWWLGEPGVLAMQIREGATRTADPGSGASRTSGASTARINYALRRLANANAVRESNILLVGREGSLVYAGD